VILDVMGSSEASAFGRQITTSKNVSSVDVPRIFIGEKTKVFDQNYREVVPGSGTVGFIARGGPVPIGYYKEPEKSAEAFVKIDGQRYSIPGDMATVENDGSLRFL
jgi:fatty-acyl-CoA synthase